MSQVLGSGQGCHCGLGDTVLCSVPSDVTAAATSSDYLAFWGGSRLAVSQPRPWQPRSGARSFSHWAASRLSISGCYLPSFTCDFQRGLQSSAMVSLPGPPTTPSGSRGRSLCRATPLRLQRSPNGVLGAVPTRVPPSLSNLRLSLRTEHRTPLGESLGRWGSVPGH